MSTSTEKQLKETRRTPSMLASWSVIGAMVVLIVLSLVLFGDGVADGPLQVSITLATLYAMSVAYRYEFRGSLISDAISGSLNGAIGTVFVIIAIGTMIGALYLSGSVAAFMYYGVAVINPRYFYVTVFLLASLLSTLVGSSFTTAGAVGTAFVALSSIMGLSPAITAGAAVSGAILGNKTSNISDTVNLTVASIGGLTVDEHTSTTRRTMIPTAVLSALIFLLIGLFAGSGGGDIDIAQVQGEISQYFDISLLAFLPVIMIFILSGLRFSAYLSLMLSAIFAWILAALTQHDLIVALAGDPSLPYFEAVLGVGIDVFSNGFDLNSGVENIDKLFTGGGVAGMLMTVWLVLVAAAFGAVVGFTGMLHRIITPVINWAKGPASLVLVTMLTSIGLNFATADPYSSIMLTSRMFRSQYAKKRFKPVLLSATIGDSGSIISHIIPWNIHGAFYAGTFGLAAVMWAPFTFFAYLTPIVTFLMIRAYFMRKDQLADDEDADQVYGAEPTDIPAVKDLA
ncbi:MAG: Na+/H+ antiporter NhaC family protein [Anaerolineales bacterium]|jgi:NhaC family Na+:H+ antiporter